MKTGKKSVVVAPAPQLLSSDDQCTLELAIIRGLPRNLHPDLVGLWEQNPAALAWRLRKALEDRVVVCMLDVWAYEHENANDLVQWGKYTDYNPLISPLNFPIDRIFGHNNVKLEFVDGRDVRARHHGPNDNDVEREDVLREAENRGLGRPTFIHALFFGKDHLAQFADGKEIVFLHEPQKIRLCECHPEWTRHLPMGDYGVIVFRADEKRRKIDLDSPNSFSADSLFPFVREEA